MSDFFNLQIVAIAHFISRSGTVFLHSLLDDHPEIASIPATFDIENLLEIKEDYSAENCFQIFKKDNPKFFDTSKFTLLDKNSSFLWRLGDSKDDKILTNEHIFKKNFLNCLKEKEINSRNVIIGLYYAYNKTHFKDLEKLKIILMHPHQKGTTIKFNKFFRDATYLIPIRNPLRAYKAIVEKTRYINKVRKIEYYPNGQLVESALDIETFLKKKFNMYFIKLEDLGDNLENIMKKLSKVLNLKFVNSMLISTFGGKKYWSNSPNKANEFDNNRHIGEASLPRKDLIIINFINSKLMNTLNYETYKLKLYEKIFLPIIFFLPLKDEIDFIKDFRISKSINYIKFLIKYFPKRLRILQIILFNKISKKYEYIIERLIK